MGTLSSQAASCDDWCTSEVFEVVHQNVTANRHFGWDKKCDWLYCGACSQCATLLQEAVLSEQHGNPFAGWISKLTGSEENMRAEEDETSKTSAAVKKSEKCMEAAKKHKEQLRSRVTKALTAKWLQKP